MKPPESETGVGYSELQTSGTLGPSGHHLEGF
jgi:hypothetical protein